MTNIFPDLDTLFEDNYELTVPATLHRAGGDVVLPVFFNRENTDVAIGDAEVIAGVPTAEARQTDITKADLNLAIDINDVRFLDDGTPVIGAAVYSYYVVALKPEIDGSVIVVLSEDLP